MSIKIQNLTTQEYTLGTMLVKGGQVLTIANTLLYGPDWDNDVQEAIAAGQLLTWTNGVLNAGIAPAPSAFTSQADNLLRSMALGGAYLSAATPPTLTTTANASNISGLGFPAVTVSPLDPRVSFTSTFALGSGFPDQSLLSFQSVDYGNYLFSNNRAANTVSADFMFDGQDFEYMSKNVGQASRVVVDGQVASPWVQIANDGSTTYTKVAFASRQPRRIRIEGVSKWGGLVLRNTDSVWAVPRALKCLIVGDSYTEGASGVIGVAAGDAYATQLGRHLGIPDCWISGVGATGYLAAPSGKKTFRGRAQADIYAQDPDVLIINGGINDGAFSAQDLVKELNIFFDEVRANLPNTLVFVGTAWRPRGSSSVAFDSALRAAVIGRDGFYLIDTSAWLTGSGKVGGLKNDGNSDVYVGADGTHPTQDGHTYLARRYADAVRVALKSTLNF